jgi:tryptophan 2,3-dioxygenase
MRHYDYTVNITWVMQHLKYSKNILNSGQGDGEATGGSDWKKYMHPKYKRIFPRIMEQSRIKKLGS